MSRACRRNELYPYYILFDSEDLISKEIRERGGFESELVNCAVKILDAYCGSTVLDIGANVGTFSFPLAKKFQDVNFHCFEAQRIVSYQLAAGVVFNGLANVIVHNAAIGDRGCRSRI